VFCLIAIQRGAGKFSMGAYKRLLWGLMNVRMPGAADEEFLAVQDEYLQEALEERGAVDINTLELPAENN